MKKHSLSDQQLETAHQNQWHIDTYAFLDDVKNADAIYDVAINDERSQELILAILDNKRTASDTMESVMQLRAIVEEYARDKVEPNVWVQIENE